MDIQLKRGLLDVCVLAAIITPPDLFTLILVTIPLYGLYEVSIRVVRRVNSQRDEGLEE